MTDHIDRSAGLDRDEDLAWFADQTVEEILAASRTVRGLLRYVEKYALDVTRCGTTIEVLLTYGGPTIWLVINADGARVKGYWSSQEYDRPVGLSSAVRTAIRDAF
jgi:hypothetical protein